MHTGRGTSRNARWCGEAQSTVGPYGLREAWYMRLPSWHRIASRNSIGRARVLRIVHAHKLYAVHLTLYTRRLHITRYYRRPARRCRRCRRRGQRSDHPWRWYRRDSRGGRRDRRRSADRCRRSSCCRRHSSCPSPFPKKVSDIRPIPSPIVTSSIAPCRLRMRRMPDESTSATIVTVSPIGRSRIGVSSPRSAYRRG